MLAAQLALSRRSGRRSSTAGTARSQVGQADGVACRTVEMFEAFGLADRLLDEAYWVNEVCFWRPDPDDRTRIMRAGRVHDTEEGLSEFPHVIVNQARMLAFLREYMERSASRLPPYYGLQATDVADRRTTAATRSRCTAARSWDRRDLDGPGEATSSAATARAARSGRRSGAI